jgi:phosphoribosylformimino-5-aminoimidazole carboxamide ribotide isomerase
MLIPAIDFRGGRIVQLVQGEREALATDDLEGWLEKFRPYPVIQVIDLDAAMGSGDNSALVARVCRERVCQVGGGIRTVDRARELIDLGAARVILGSALFDDTSVNTGAARMFEQSLGADKLIAAVDSRGGLVVTRGWKERTTIDVLDAVRALSPYVGGFLATLVDTEGLMQGLDFDAVARLRAATTRSLTVAGGVRDLDDVQRLEALGADAVAGMAIYTGRIAISS